MRALYLTSILTVLLSGTGCYTVTLPIQKGGEAQFNFAPTDFKLLGPVEVEGSTEIFLGVLGVPREPYGYAELLAKAKRKMNADTVIDVVVDGEQTAVFGVLVFVYKWKASGMAVRYEEHIYRRSGPAAPQQVSLPTTEVTGAPETKPTSPWD